MRTVVKGNAPRGEISEIKERSAAEGGKGRV